MSFPLYRLTLVRTDTSRRDPPKRKRAPDTRIKIPIYRVVLRKERTIRLRQEYASNEKQAAMIAWQLIGDSPAEKLLVLLLNSQHRVVGAIVAATTSGIASARVEIRGIFTSAIAHNASAIILAHNHPSGDPAPSREDLEMLDRAREASKVVGIPILDSIVVTMDPDEWRSHG